MAGQGRRLTVVLMGMLLLAAACEVPGAAGVAQVVTCLQPRDRSAPPLPATAFQPVWRTYRDGPEHLSLSLPETWAAVFTGTSHTDGDLATETARLPDLADDFRQTVSDLSSTYSFLAEDDVFGAALYASETAYSDPQTSTQVCQQEATTYLDPRGPGLLGPGRVYRTQLGAGTATEVVFRERPAAPASPPATHLLFFVTAANSTVAMRMDFSFFDTGDASTVEAIAWRIAGSLTAVDGTATTSCLFPDPTQPGVRAPAGRTCPVPVGDQQYRLDCPIGGGYSDGVDEVDNQTGDTSGFTSVEQTSASCALSTDPGNTVSLTPNIAGSRDEIAVVDAVLPGLPTAALRFAIPVRTANAVTVQIDRSGHVTVAQRKGGADQPPLATFSVPGPGTRFHRLVVALSSAGTRVWFDGRAFGPFGPFATSVPSAAGPPQLAVVDDDADRPIGLTFQGLAVYAGPSGAG